METAKVFVNGGSQAIRLPKPYQFSEKELLANKVGDVLILMPPTDPWAGMMQSFSMFTDDFMAEDIEDLPIQEREFL